MRNEFGFQVERGEEVIKITNKTDFWLDVIKIPTYPRRRLEIVLTIMPANYGVIDSRGQDEPFDLTSVYFRLREATNERS